MLELVRGYSSTFLIDRNEHYGNKLRAKLFNLVDSIFTEEKQRESVKGLMRDFTAEVHFGLNRDIFEYLEFLKVRKPQDGCSPTRLQDNPELGRV